MIAGLTVQTRDLASRRCTHIFAGHKRTICCVVIVKPELAEVEGEGGVIPKREWPLFTNDKLLKEDIENNPHHKLHLEGHGDEVRALAARGRTLAFGSYDRTIRTWDIVTGGYEWVLLGHTYKVFNVVLDLDRNIVCSGSMNCTVRIWDLPNGQCQRTFTKHVSLVGLLRFSSSCLVSSSADATLCVWDPDIGELRHRLAAYGAGAITCFQHDELKVLSGSEGRWCVAASHSNNKPRSMSESFGEGTTGLKMLPPSDEYNGETPFICNVTTTLLRGDPDD